MITRENTRDRLLNCALRLFTLHSFAGTSLQMIADNLGVTKAAIYHHFKTRDDILTAVLQPALEELRDLIAYAESLRTPHARADALLVGFVDMTVRHRELIGIVGTDPGVGHALSTHPDIAELFGKPLTLLAAADPGPAGEVNASLALSGIACTASSPMLTHLDDATLRDHLLAAGRRLLGLRAPRRTLTAA
ncbi:AcrR family transcriptional regulator [Allocatelliglobosispora scoriae]|uniref:AcrR family transcriptional regulator n=1 Tax=Allocatelliglobosispora scoriae TaxID=643052 RepID=A0A841C3X5_9ACTN|nr:TetR/AcrR family transcriptional regulator [Allocatelliglobosispora scoriae]MBB5873762.1 AcrR family transcriptional regulator [Allocatelliglobosispora scoriae]